MGNREGWNVSVASPLAILLVIMIKHNDLWRIITLHLISSAIRVTGSTVNVRMTLNGYFKA